MSLRNKILTGSIALVLSSSTLMAFLGKWEGEGQNVVYPDKLARGLPTVCKGITRYTSPYPVVVGDYWSPARCAEVEQMVVEKGQLGLADCLTNDKISQNTFDALSSHGHHFGTPSTCASRALVLINAGLIQEGCRALAWGPDGRPVWAYITDDKGKKVFVRGLHNRQLDEARLCAS